MLVFVLACVLSVSISFLCSLAESVFYSVPLSFLESQRQRGHQSAVRLFNMRMAPEKPIAAILTLNTVSNTAGAAIASAAFTTLFGVAWLPVFAIVFTIAILLFSEILPKTIGVNNARAIAPYLSTPLYLLIKTLNPLIWLCNMPARLLRLGKKTGAGTSAADLTAFLSLSSRAGIIKPEDEKVIINVISLADKHAKDIMTPRRVVFSLPEGMTLEEARQEKEFAHYTRIPVYTGGDADNIIAMVDRRAILMALLDGRGQDQVSQLSEPAQFIPETLPLDRLLSRLLESRTHLFIVVDEYGGFAGVVSLEDVLEEILGREIVEHTDLVANLQDLAKGQRPPTAD